MIVLVMIKIVFEYESIISNLPDSKGEFTQYPFIVLFFTFCFFLKKYALFYPHFQKSIPALSRLLYIGENFVQKFGV